MRTNDFPAMLTLYSMAEEVFVKLQGGAVRMDHVKMCDSFTPNVGVARVCLHVCLQPTFLKVVYERKQESCFEKQKEVSVW